MKERQTALIEYVSSHGKVEVSVLAEYLNTSKVTVRKDLDLLAEKGILKRERGYAVLPDPDDMNYRMAFHYQVKQKIAKLAAGLVEDGETILVEAGSVCAMFAEEVARIKQGVTIITNSAHVANYIRGYSGAEILLLGGNYQKNRQAVVGPMTKACVKEFRVDKIFAGTDGYSRQAGFMGNDLVRSDTLKAMIESAHHVYILTESEKFRRCGTVSFLQLEEVYQVITDEHIPEEEAAYLKKLGIKVELV